MLPVMHFYSGGYFALFLSDTYLGTYRGTSYVVDFLWPGRVFLSELLPLL